MLTASQICSTFLAGAVLFAGLVPATAADREAAKSGIVRFDAAVDRAVAHLHANAGKITAQNLTLASYALLKAGADDSQGIIKKGIGAAKERALVRGYSGYDHIYLSGVDAMLLADSEPGEHLEELQAIAAYVESAQRADGSWSNGPTLEGDVSMCQYGMLAYWSAMRSGCNVSPAAIAAAASWLIQNGNPDGGWPYRPGTAKGHGMGASTHNMTASAAGSMAICQWLVFGKGKNAGARGSEEKTETGRFGGLLQTLDDFEEAEKQKEIQRRASSENVNLAESTLNAHLKKSMSWLDSRYEPVSRQPSTFYFYYAFERAASLIDRQDRWFEDYGDGLLSLQKPDGSFETANGTIVGTSFAILYFSRSTRQIINAKQYGLGIQVGGRDVESLFYGKKTKTELGPLDSLLKAMEGQDFASLDVSTDDLVQKIQFSSRDELVGETDKLRTLLKSPDPANRQVAYWALGRTCDFDLIPLMLEGLKDPSIDVNVEALAALRYISRKPNGFGLTFDPLNSLPESATEEDRVKAANNWRTKAINTWQTWYAGVRPYESGDGLDEFSR